MKEDRCKTSSVT